MGTEALWVPAVIGAVSAGVGYYNNQQTLKKQDEAATQGLLTQQALQTKANSDINQQLNTLQRSNPNAAADASRAGFITQLQRAQATAQQTTPPVAGANARYGQQVAAGRAANVGAEGAQANSLSQIAAPALQRQQEASGINDLAAALGEIGAQSRAQDFLTQLRVRSAQNNPWLTALAAAGSGAASGMASRIPPATDMNAAQWARVGRGLPGSAQLYDTTNPYGGLA